MLSYIPPQKPASALLFSSSCVAAGLILFALSSYILHRYPLLPIVSLVLVLLGIWFMYRFALMSYRYEIRDGVLCIHRRLFRAERTVYTLSLRTGTAVIPMDDTAAKKRIGKPHRTHNFLTVWPSEHPVILYYRDAGRLCSVILEDNPAFFSAAAQYFPNIDTDCD